MKAFFNSKYIFRPFGVSVRDSEHKEDVISITKYHGDVSKFRRLYLT